MQMANQRWASNHSFMGKDVIKRIRSEREIDILIVIQLQ